MTCGEFAQTKKYYYYYYYSRWEVSVSNRSYRAIRRVKWRVFKWMLSEKETIKDKNDNQLTSCSMLEVEELKEECLWGNSYTSVCEDFLEEVAMSKRWGGERGEGESEGEGVVLCKLFVGVASGRGLHKMPGVRTPWGVVWSQCLY